MFRKVAAISLVFLALAVVVAVWRAPMTTTVSVGSGPVALIQNLSVSELGVPSGTAITLTTPSTAGTALVAIIANGGAPGAGVVTTFPAGWVKLLQQQQGTQVDLEVWVYLNNPGGIAAVTYTTTAAFGAWHSHLSEWSNVVSASAVEASGTTSATSGTTLVPTTTTNVQTNGDLAISAWHQYTGSVGVVTFTTPGAWTRLADDSAVSQGSHLDIEYRIGPATGALLGPVLTSNTATSSAAGFTLVLKATAPIVDQTAFLQYDSVSLKLNTADFALMLGGRYLLESATTDVSGYQLEDGSGALILDTYIPQLGDPVTFTGPAWTGRVVSVHRESIVEPHSNYRKAGVSATNSAAAPGGIAPGDFSDVAAGGYFVLEDSSGNLQLQDGTGNYLQEGTTFSYRNLTFRQSQNQDGTTTVYGTLETFEGGFLAGQSFLLSNADLGISSQTYTITNVTTTFIGAASTTPVYLIEFGDPYLSLQLAGAGVLTQQGSQASIQQGVFMPGGMLGYAQITANQGTITTEVDVTGLTRTVTVAAGRRIMVSAYGKIASTIGTDTVRLSLYEGLTLLTYDETVPNSTSPTPALKPAIPLQPSAGAHTYNVKAVRAAGTGTVTIFGSTASPAWIMVEDIGT